MINKNLINKMLKARAKQAKRLFNLCEINNEGTYDKLHIIENSRFPDEKKEYRVYHADGYCFDITKEKIELSEDESCDSGIGGYEYIFNEGLYEGFKEITVEEAIKLLKQL
jgi:hypothetical protein